MKKVKVYEFKDLPKKIQEKAWNEAINSQVEFELDMLWHDVREGRLSEKEAWEIIGCSRSYGESTPWFVPSVYYENHEKAIIEAVRHNLKDDIFDKTGDRIVL